MAYALHALMTNPGIRWQWVYAVDDTAETDAATTASGNVLTGDVAVSKAVSRVNGSAGNVGEAVAGSNGGLFTIGSDGAWSFDPNSEFATLTGDQTATTSVSYHVSDGVAEDEGTLTVTVSAAPAEIVRLGSISAASDSNDVYSYRSISIPAEWGLATGDLLIVYHSVLRSSNIDLYISGFEELADLYASDSYSCNFGVHYKVVGDVVDTMVTIPDYGNYKGATIAEAWRGVDLENPIDAFSTAYASNSGTINNPAITPVTTGSVIIAAGGFSSMLVPSAYNPPSGFDSTGYTINTDVSNSMIGVALAMQEWAGGSVDPAAWSVTLINQQYGGWCAATIALRPAS